MTGLTIERGALSRARINDELRRAARIGREEMCDLGLRGYGAFVLFSEDGDVLQAFPFANLITDAGDLYYASMGQVGVSPSTPSAPTLVTGMKLGTGATAVAKNGAGSALVTYGTGVTANKVFDATFPSTTNLGAGNGVEIQYQTSWSAGQATVTGLAEAVIVTDASTDATSTAAHTISRILLSPTVNKGASDTLAAIWSHLFKGA